MRLLISFAALFLSVILLQLSSGGVGPLDALSGLQLHFSHTEVGLLGSAHFAGFFIGCWWAPRLMSTIGHSRSFAAFTAMGAIGLLSHMLVIEPAAWAAMRVATGICVAGCFTVIEAWLQAKATNETRGRTMGIYRVVDLGASLAAQLVISVLEPASYVSYNLLALLCCASLLPLTLTRVTPPETPPRLRLKPLWALSLSPLAVGGVVVAGITGASFRMVGPLYAAEVGLRVDQIALFLAAFVAGGAVAQYPLGWLADKFDRRWVLIGLSIAAMGSCATTVAASTGGTSMVMTASALFGFATFPIFSVASAHAHDQVSNDQRVELSAALMFFFALGAIASPIVSSSLIESHGPAALFAFIAGGHAVLVVLGLGRMLMRPSVEKRTRYIYAPRTSFMIGRLTGKARERD
ncbi:MAG: MFS transporter [Brevirhabdus sp.]